MNSKVRVALVGAGFPGQAHAFGYRNIGMSDALQGVEVVLDTVVDPNVELAATVAARYGFERFTGSLDDVLKDPSIDAVSSALPQFASFDVLGRVLDAGKHVFSEKPLGLSAAEAEALTELAARAGKIAAVGFSYRRVPAMAALRQVVQEGGIGRPYFARGHYYADYAADPRGARTWRFQQELSGGGAIADIGVHVIDALTSILGPISEVTAALFETHVAERPLPTGGSGHTAAVSETERGEVTNDDTALLTVRFASGAVGSIQLSRAAMGAPNELGVEVYGSAGHASFDCTRSDEFTLYDATSASAAPGFDGPRRVIAGPAFPYYSDVSSFRARGTGTGYGEAFLAEIQEFVGAIVSGSQMDTSFTATVHPMRVVQAAFDSARTNSPVAVKEYSPVFA